jgi:hypothetical protein
MCGLTRRQLIRLSLIVAASCLVVTSSARDRPPLSITQRTGEPAHRPDCGLRGWPDRDRLIIPHKSGRGVGAAVMDEAELTGERGLIGGGELMGCVDEMGIDFARRTRRIGGAVHGVARNRIREESSRVKERRWWDGIGDAGAAVV